MTEGVTRPGLRPQEWVRVEVPEDLPYLCRIKHAGEESESSLRDRSSLRLLYQTSHLFSGGRTISEPALQLKAFWKAGMLESGPITRYLATG